MGKFDGILFCSDLDGTLLSDDKSIPKKNLDAIEYFKSEGGLFTIISGRVPITAKYVIDAVKPNAPVGCFNGAALYDSDTGEYVWHDTLDTDVTELIKCVDENVPEVGIEIYSWNGIYICKESDAMGVLKTFPYEFCQYNEIDDIIAKVAFAHSDNSKIEKVADILSVHQLSYKFDFVRSASVLYEVLPKNTNKGVALVKLAEHLGCKKTIAAGDYYNDVTMLQNAVIGCAVSNACDEAKAAADIITVSNEECAIAKIIDDLDKGIIKL